ncbi:protein O-mannosyl-transferase 2-like [Penaeus indicus]|uniref:protein O-mannosyl-transferase 2-like n=1 Tax=Penaeus indicus TaxID=29960 RepID=UPI00300D378D
MDEFRAGGSNRMWWTVFWVFVAAAVGSRLHFITMPYKVVWDEAHFGKMVSWYINRTFFFDVHPVGGKVEHPLTVQTLQCIIILFYVTFRQGCALMGAALVPLGFHIVWTLTKSLPASTFAAGLITFEVGTITLSKFILLDPLLLFFIMASFHGLTFMHEAADRSFSKQWWFAYLYTGAMLGCVMSVKFVGLFVVLVVGLYAALDLWQKLGELDRPLLSVATHFMARVLTLILLPAAIYVSVFFIHDQLLFKAKTLHAADEGTFSPGFQMRLKTNFLNNLTQPKQLAYGNVITLRNANLAGIYLHSHNATYPQEKVGKNKQQLTGFGAKDVNNYFKVLFPEEDPDLENSFYDGLPEYVMNGDWVRLYHLTTQSLVSCDRNMSLVTRKHNLAYAKAYNLTDPAVAAKINRAFDDDPEASVSNPNVTMWQLWSVHIVGGQPGEAVKVLDSRVKFICLPLTCALTWSREKLPLKWGFNQQEITCSKNVMDDHTNWMVELNLNPYLKNESFSHLESGFFSRMIETHRVMTFINARLKPEGEDRYNSHRPWMWPFCLKSQVWFDVYFRIVLLGNPIIFWINLVFLVVVPGLIIAHYYRLKRGHTDRPQVRVHIVGGQPGEAVKVLDSRVKFICLPLTCALTWSREKLPLKWGFNQQEITCSKNVMDDHTNWMPEGEDRYNSHRPWMWPFCLKSQVWFDVYFRIVLLGNPIIFWINLVFLVVVPGLIIAHYYRLKRGHTDRPQVREQKERMIFACKWLFLAYLFHYIPFYTMDRILYYHHYFPALQFSSMLTAVVFGYLLESLDTWLPVRKARLAFHWATGVFFAIVLYSFHLYCYVGYGHPTVSGFNPDNSTFKNIRVFDSWEI